MSGAGPDCLSADASTVGAAPPGSFTVTWSSLVVVVFSSSVAVTVTVCTPGVRNVQSNDDPSTVPPAIAHS